MANPSIPELFDLRSKVAVVTGGAAGIGSRVAARLGGAGAALLITDVDRAAGERTLTELRTAGYRAELLISDVREVDQAARVVRTAVETLGGLDILVNNAGIFPSCPALALTEALWDKTMDINLKGAF